MKGIVIFAVFIVLAVVCLIVVIIDLMRKAKQKQNLQQELNSAYQAELNKYNSGQYKAEVEQNSANIKPKVIKYYSGIGMFGSISEKIKFIALALLLFNLAVAGVVAMSAIFAGLQTGAFPWDTLVVVLIALLSAVVWWVVLYGIEQMIKANEIQMELLNTLLNKDEEK